MTLFKASRRWILSNNNPTILLGQEKQIVSPFTESSGGFPYPGLSYHVGPTVQPLKHVTLAELLREQVILNGESEALVSSWQSVRCTYRELDHQSDELAKSFWGLGVRKGDRMAIMAGNCAEYILVWSGLMIYIEFLGFLRRSKDRSHIGRNKPFL